LHTRSIDRLHLQFVFLSIEQGSSSEVGLVPDAICGGGGGGIIELDFAQSKAAYLPYASTPSHSVSSRKHAMNTRNHLKFYQDPTI
jgi:hypothetical protein